MNVYLQRLVLFAIATLLAPELYGQCADNIITNSGFESGAFTDWWNWHDNSPDAYSFATSDDAYTGDSSAVINVLVDTDLIPGGQGGEYNTRPQVNPIIGGQFYQITFYAKSTLDNTEVPIYIKDENDGWILLHSDVGTVGTDWTEVTSIFRADTDRADIHLEIKVYNEDFSEPYSLFIDDVSICQADILTYTCEENIVANPGFEEGAYVDWGNWHGGEETDYSFATSDESAVGDSSARINVLKPSSELTGAGEFNSRPQVSPVVSGQNYQVTLWGKSTLENTVVQVWVKDEFDGWTTIGNCDLTVGTEWTEVSFIFANDIDRDDVHVELKVFNEGFEEPYSVWFDEVSICETTDEPNCGVVEEPDPVIFGSTSSTSSCLVNLADEFSSEDLMDDLMGWDIWDGSEDEEFATFELDPVLPYSGDASMRVDITENHDVAEFHHRFGNDVVLEDGVEYTVTMWMRTNVPAGDTMRAFTRAVRDTDWGSQFIVDFIGTENEWLNYSFTFTADGTWDNAFLEMKFYRVTGFTGAYSVWLDEVQICRSGDAVVGLNGFKELDLAILLAPNPVFTGAEANVMVEAETPFHNATISLIDLVGRTRWNQSVDVVRGQQHINIPTQGLAAGVYLVQIQHEGLQKTMKLQVLGHR